MSNRKLIEVLPFVAQAEDHELPVGLWSSDENLCEYAEGCVENGLYFGTTNELEPQFCGRHFFGEAVAGDRGYKLVHRRRDGEALSNTSRSSANGVD